MSSFLLNNYSLWKHPISRSLHSIFQPPFPLSYVRKNTVIFRSQCFAPRNHPKWKRRFHTVKRWPKNSNHHIFKFLFSNFQITEFSNTLIDLPNNHDIVLPIFLGAFGTCGVPHVLFGNGQSFRFGQTFVILAPFTGVLERPFIDFAIEFSTERCIFNFWNILINR